MQLIVAAGVLQPEQLQPNEALIDFITNRLAEISHIVLANRTDS